MSTPLLSVLIPNYNHGQYLRKCFAGILNQSFDDYEILITDDGSKDHSRTIIEEAARRDGRIRPSFFPSNRGLEAAFADLIERATGKYVFWEAADDFLVNPEFFLHAVRALEADPRPAGFYGVVGLLSAETEKLVGAMGTALTEGYNAPFDCYMGFVKCKAIVPSSSLVFRRELMMRHGCYDFSLGPQSDLYLNHLLASTYGMVFEKSPAACQRVFAKRNNYGASGSLWEMIERFANLEARLRKVGISYPEMENDWQAWRVVWALDCIRKTGFNAGQLPGAPAF